MQAFGIRSGKRVNVGDRRGRGEIGGVGVGELGSWGEGEGAVDDEEVDEGWMSAQG